MSLKSLALFCSFSALVSGAASAASFDVFSATGSDAASIQSTVDDFRNALGALNAPEPVNAPGGRRQINWDAAPDAISDPNPFPGDFFNFPAAPRARGIEFQATGSTKGFELSATEASGTPKAFGKEDDFLRFSEERLFRQVGGDTFDAVFYDPAKPEEKATSTGLGVVFSDVEVADNIFMEFFDLYGNSLAKKAVEPFRIGQKDGEGGLSFLGLIFDDPLVSKVSFSFNQYAYDDAVMDDFIFGEPIPVGAVPLPASVLFLLGGFGILGGLRRMRA